MKVQKSQRFQSRSPRPRETETGSRAAGILKINKGQSLVEYTAVVGIVIVVFITMNPMIKRGIQGMIRTVADQVGNQEDAEQRFNESYLNRSTTEMAVSSSKITQQRLTNLTTTYDESVTTSSDALLNLGFTERIR